MEIRQSPMVNELVESLDHYRSSVMVPLSYAQSLFEFVKKNQGIAHYAYLEGEGEREWYRRLKSTVNASQLGQMVRAWKTTNNCKEELRCEHIRPNRNP